MIQYDAAAASSAWPPGDYEAVLAKVEETKSKAGNPMYVLTWTCYNESGAWLNLKQYVVVPQGLFNLKGLAFAWGKLEEFKDNQFDPHKYVDKHVMLTLDVEESPRFGDKNKIISFAPAPTGGFASGGVAKADDDKPVDPEDPFI